MPDIVDFTELFENASVPLHVVGPDGTILHANRAELELLGYRADEYIGRKISEFHEDADVVADILRRLTAGERIRDHPARLRAKDGSIRHVLIDSSGRFDDGRFVYTRCCTRDVTAEVAARRLAEETRERFAFLAEASNLLAGSLDCELTLQHVTRLLVPRVADWAAIHVVADDQSVQLVALAHVDADKERIARAWLGRHPVSLRARYGIPVVIRTGESLLRPQVAPEMLERAARTPEELEALRALGIRSAIVVPLTARGQTFGAITVMTAESGRTYGDADLLFMQDLGRRAGLAADNARLYEQAEAAADATARLAAIVRDSTDAIISKTLDGTITSWNRAAERMYGYEASEVIGKPITIIVPPGYHGEELEFLARLRRGEHLEHYETVRVRKDGCPVDVSLTVSPVRNARGEIIGASKVARDITARKRAEEERRQLLEREQAARAEADAGRRYAEFLADTAAVLSSSLDYEVTLGRVARLMVPQLADLAAIDMLDEDGSIRRLATAHVDPAYEQRARDNRNRHGYSPHGPIATAMRTGTSQLMTEVPDEHLVRMAANPEQLAAFRDLGITSGMFVPLRARGQTLGVITLLATTKSGRHYTGQDLGRLEDLAQRAAAAIDNARLYRAAERARALAESANRAKDAFLATVSHELRTPLNAILGWARMIQTGELDPAGLARAARTIVQSASSQAQLIDDLLDLSRIATGRMRLNFEMCNLGTVVEQALEAVRPSADAKRIVLSSAIPSDGAAIVGAPDRLQQVVWNLVVNAIKFTPRGGRVAVEVREAPGHVEIVVADDGEGIAPEMLPHVFEQFRQEDSSTTRAHGGLGLGLTLVKHLVELHGGQVRAHSSGKGRGTTFTVTLPRSGSAGSDGDVPGPGG